MDGSILTTTKKLLGIDESNTDFDVDVTMYINSAFATLWERGVGPKECFAISDKNTNWSSFSSRSEVLGMLPTYIFCDVRIKFDPPTQTSLLESLKNLRDEYGFRLAALYGE